MKRLRAPGDFTVFLVEYERRRAEARRRRASLANPTAHQPTPVVSPLSAERKRKER